MSKKTCIKIIESPDNSKILYICLDGFKEISKKILNEKERRFRMIVECIFNDKFNRELYERYSTYKGTATMKISKGKENLRIYCKIEDKEDELGNTIQHITMVKLHHKKSQELTKKEKQILQSIQKKSYEYKQWDQSI